MVKVIRVRGEILHRMLDEARRTPLEECCGLLGARSGVISGIFPARNARASRTAYEIAPEELFPLMRRLRAAGLALAGIYHSHPAGDNVPSPLDVERAYYPETPYFILSPLPESPHPVRAFSIHNGRVTELTIKPA